MKFQLLTHSFYGKPLIKLLTYKCNIISNSPCSFAALAKGFTGHVEAGHEGYVVAVTQSREGMCTVIVVPIS